MIPGPFSKIVKTPLSNFQREQTEMTIPYNPTEQSIESDPSDDEYQINQKNQQDNQANQVQGNQKEEIKEQKVQQSEDSKININQHKLNDPRKDIFGNMIDKKRKQHKICFQEDVQVFIVDNWKELNYQSEELVFENPKQTTTCCKCLIT